MTTIYKTTSGTPDFSSPKGLAYNPHLEQLAVCDAGNNQLMICDIHGFKELDTTDSYDSNDLADPEDVYYFDGHYYVCDGNHTLVRYRARDLSYRDHFGTYGTSGSTTAKLKSPTGVTGDGRFLYVADYGNSRIMKLLMSTLAYDSQTANINGALSSPTMIYAHRLGRDVHLYVSDAGNSRLIKCDTNFSYLAQNSTGVGTPQGIIILHDLVHVLDSINNRVTVLKSIDLSAVTTLSDTTITLSSPKGIEVYGDAIIIADNGNDRLTAWRGYIYRDLLDTTSAMKFGGEFLDNPMVIVGDDSLIAGDTEEYGSPNRWKEENSNFYSLGWVEEDDLTAPSWSEE